MTLTAESFSVFSQPYRGSRGGPAVHDAQRTTGRHRRQAIFEEASAVLEQQYSRPGLSADDVALAVLTSRRQLQRAFTEAGTSFRNELGRLRMRRAAALLERFPQMPVSEVGARVGYRQPAQFAKAFSRTFGMAPSVWRQTRRTSNADRH